MCKGQRQELTLPPASKETQSQPVRHQYGSNQHNSDQRFHRQTHVPSGSPSAMPPTPPMRPGSSFEGHQSPPVASSQSSVSLSHYAGSSMSNVEPHQQRQLAPSTDSYAPAGRYPPQSPFVSPPYILSPSSTSSYPYTSQASPPTNGLVFHQRPLAPPEATTPTSNGTHSDHNSLPVDHANPWQHHHYISPSASAAFANQQSDRYICQTCSKAFSRPSSLRIHSHSHTGEKPFKCPHVGCGKAFSVRSNMKRHERGCHGSGSPGSG